MTRKDISPGLEKFLGNKVREKLLEQKKGELRQRLRERFKNEKPPDWFGFVSETSHIFLRKIPGPSWPVRPYGPCLV